MRRKPMSDTRLDWRDPKMPVLRDYEMADGSKKQIVDPDYERRYHEHILNQDRPEPDYRRDPTYNMRRKK